MAEFQKILQGALTNATNTVQSKITSPVKPQNISSNDLKNPKDLPNLKYTVQISCHDLNVAFVGFLPEQITLDVNSSYNTPFEDLAIGNGGMLGGALSLGGSSGMAQAMTIQVWQGSSGLEMALPITLVAKVNPHLEIRDPLLSLYKLVSPQADGKYSLMTPPGPSLKVGDRLKSVVSSAVDSAGNILKDVVGLDNSGGDGHFLDSVKDAFTEGLRNQISIKIGEFLYFDSVVVKGISTQWDSLIDKATGMPWKCTVTVQFCTLYNPVLNDLYQIFGAPIPEKKS